MIETKVLNSGVRVVMENVPYVQSVSMGIWVKAGSTDETPENCGISHYIEHMLFKGSENRSAKQLAADVDRIGASINAFTGKNATCYYVKTLTEEACQGAEILSDLFSNPLFDPEEMKKERNVICEEMKMSEDDPDDHVMELLTNSILKGTGYDTPILGTRKSLKGIKRENILDYIGREYTTDNIVLAISGNFDADRLCQIFEEGFVKFNRKKAPKPVAPMNYEKNSILKVKDVEQAHICLGVPAIKIDHPLFYSLAVVNNIFGGTMSSRLFQHIREDKGLAYSVFSHPVAFLNYGYYNIFAGVGSDKIPEAIHGILDEAVKLKKEGITREEMESAKIHLKSSIMFGQESIGNRMNSMGKNMILLNKVYTPEDILEKIQAVSMEDAERAIDIIAQVENYSAAVVTGKRLNLKKVMDR